MGFWKCLECGTMEIMDLAFCPSCRKPRPADETPAASVPESGTQGEEGIKTATPEPQAKTGRKSDAKS